MKIDILTLFPAMFNGPFDQSIIKRAQNKKLVEINIHNLRDWAKDKHKTVDDRPYGGGPGMIIKVQPIFDALKDIKNQSPITNHHSPFTILLSPQGKVFNQQKAKQLSKLKHLILICGHYEGFDQRIKDHLIDEEISIGNYVLTGGELPAMVVTDTIVRLIPGVLQKPQAVKNESFSHQSPRPKDGRPLDEITNHQSPILDFPQYTRPANFKGWKVPEILLSGDHKKIEKWRKKQALQKTKKKRPELIKISNS